jgi:hypothetical protein
MSNLHLGAWGDLSRIPLAKAAVLKAIELDSCASILRVLLKHRFEIIARPLKIGNRGLLK